MLLFLIMEADVLTIMELFRHEHIGFVFVGQVKISNSSISFQLIAHNYIDVPVLRGISVILFLW